MGKQLEKAVERLLSEPSDYTYEELTSLLRKLGYEEKQKGKTSGSRVRFFNSIDKHVIMLHKPHPGNIIKRYAIKQVIIKLKEKGRI